jgi:hypothetical protein
MDGWCRLRLLAGRTVDTVRCLPPPLEFTWFNPISNHHSHGVADRISSMLIHFSYLVAPILLLRRRSCEGHTRSRQPTLHFQSTSFLEPSDNNAQQSTPQAATEISTVASSGFGVLVADIHGSIHLLNRDFESTNSWVAHVAGRVTHMVERQGVLVTLGVRPILLSLQIHVV